MFANSLARVSAILPSSLKYRLATIRPIYSALMRFSEPITTAQTIAGQVNWQVDALTSQEYLLGTYERYMQQAFVNYIREGAIVYDVGAHAGFHSLLCSLLAGSSGRVIAFEPNPQNRASIARQLSVNPRLQISVSPYALSDRCEVVPFDVSNGSSQGHLSGTGNFEVETRSLDFVIDQEEFPAPNVIKIDVEGHEEKVLVGGLETINRCKPVILCDRNDDGTFSTVRALLEPYGYRVADGWPIIATHAGSRA